MKVKIHRIYPFKSDGPLQAFVDVLFDDELLVKGIKVLKGHNGLFVSLPQEKGKDDKWYESVRFKDPERRKMFNLDILKEYNKLTEDDSRLDL